MEKIKMTNQERELLDNLDKYLAKVSERPPEISLFRFQAVLFKSICDKIGQGMIKGKIDPDNETYDGVPIRCQY